MSNNLPEPQTRTDTYKGTCLPLSLREWDALQAHHKSMSGTQMRDLFKDDPQRFEKFHVKNNGVLFDYSKHLITDETRTLLLDLAKAQNLEHMRDAMFNGAPINTTENRAVLHTALRGSLSPNVQVDGEHIQSFVTDLQKQMRTLSDDVRNDKTITDVVNIGIGGSDIGPHMVCEALHKYANGPHIHFVSNIDGDALLQILDGLEPNSTVFVVSSKTFTTLETIENAKAAKAWANGKSRFFAVTGNKQAAMDFGAREGDILPLPEWIGGRYSVWSGIGLSICFSLGFTHFEDFLKGAHAADEHFKTAPPEQNISILMGLLGVWYNNFFNFPAHGVLAYAKNLGHFPRYIRQIDMESNGKYVDHDGNFVQYATGPIIMGGIGTSAQHAFFQSLHQGTDIIPCDFIVPVTADHDLESHHTHLLTNALAQSQALMNGRDNPDDPHRHFSGNRPSSMILIDKLDPYHLGMLMALYEHKIFVQGIIWHINSFDQFGVELGKTLARDIVDMMEGTTSDAHLDASTKALIAYIKTHS